MLPDPPGLSVPARVVHCAEALAWLRAQPVLAGCSVVTSLPDVSELAGAGPESWRAWFGEAAGLILSRLPDEGVAIFYQTDVKPRGRWVDKAYLVQRAAEDAGVPLLFHRIVCRKPAGTVTWGRAGYAHLLGFSRGVLPDPARGVADVLAEGGAMTWVRAIPLDACRAACRFVATQTATRTIVDPFCGVGTALAVANELGLAAIGVEQNRKRAARARALTLERA